MASALDDFRRHVLHGPYEAVSSLPIGHVAFGQAKICDLDVPLAVEQYILLQAMKRFSPG